jgi:hypothetical protein
VHSASEDEWRWVSVAFQGERWASEADANTVAPRSFEGLDGERADAAGRATNDLRGQGTLISLALTRCVPPRRGCTIRGPRQVAFPRPHEARPAEGGG